MGLLEKPSLPSGKVTALLCAAREEISKELSSFGAEVIKVEKDSRLPKAVCDHTDMLCCHLGGDTIVTFDKELANKLGQMGLRAIVTEREPGNEYPNDVPLNCARIGNILLYNRKTAASEIIEYALNNSLTLSDVRQGYSRCSCAIVDERSVITSDKAIAQRLISIGLDVLLIRPGYIKLPGYGYGFIGGACGKLSPDKMYFSGSLDGHPDKNDILSFLSRKGVEPVFGKGELCDFGGFIPIMEG